MSCCLYADLGKQDTKHRCTCQYTATLSGTRKRALCAQIVIAPYPHLQLPILKHMYEGVAMAMLASVLKNFPPLRD